MFIMHSKYTINSVTNEPFGKGEWMTFSVQLLKIMEILKVHKHYGYFIKYAFHITENCQIKLK